MARPDIEAIRARLDAYPTREQLAMFFMNFGYYPNQDADTYASMLSMRLVPPIDIEDLRKVEQNALVEAVRLLAERGVITQFTEKVRSND